MTKSRIQLLDNVFLTCVPADKFKTDFLSAQFITPLRADTAGSNALLPAVLLRGTETYPDMQRLSAALDNLYGATVSNTLRKRGENQLWGFAATCVDEAFLPGGVRLLEPLAEILGEILCRPVMEGGVLSPAYVASERSNRIDAIRAAINDKRAFSSRRLLEEMCRGEAYALPHMGDEASVSAITPESLTAHYRAAVARSRLELYYCGRAEQERVADAFRAALRDLPRGEEIPLAAAQPHPPRPEPRLVREQMDVSQGKLCVGYSVDTSDTAAVTMMNTMFGATSTSKLFLNVREKLSLCYYASSTYHRAKNMITVSSGIEFENFQRALDEIEEQLSAMQRGDWEPWELAGARSCLANGHRSIFDSASQLEDFYMGQIATGRDDDPIALLEAALTATPERIQAAAKAVKLDTIYFLTGKEAADHAGA